MLGVKTLRIYSPRLHRFLLLFFLICLVDLLLLLDNLAECWTLQKCHGDDLACAQLGQGNRSNHVLIDTTVRLLEAFGNPSKIDDLPLKVKFLRHYFLVLSHHAQMVKIQLQLQLFFEKLGEFYQVAYVVFHQLRGQGG